MLLRSMTLTIVTVAIAIAGSAASMAPGGDGQAGPLVEAYQRLTGYLCDDPEYLACLGIGTAQCEQDMKTATLLSCGQGPYIMSDQAGQGRANVSLVPVGLAECIYLSHIEAHRRDAAEVHACMAAAKLEQ